MGKGTSHRRFARPSVRGHAPAYDIIIAHRTVCSNSSSIQKYIVGHVFTDAQRARLEGPGEVRPAKTRKQLADEQAERIRMAASLWAGKRHVEEVARSHKVTQRMSDAMVAHNIRMANEAQDYLNRRRREREKDKDSDRDREDRRRERR